MQQEWITLAMSFNKVIELLGQQPWRNLHAEIETVNPAAASLGPDFQTQIGCKLRGVPLELLAFNQILGHQSDCQVQY